MPDNSALLETNFLGTIQKYCAEQGWTINRVVNNAVVLRFEGEQGIPILVFVISEDTSVHFKCPSNLYYPEIGEIPHRLSTRLLQGHDFDTGVWSIQKLDEQFNFVLNWKVGFSLMDARIFGELIRCLVEQCDNTNISGDNLMVLTPANFKTNVENYCEKYGWPVAEIASDYFKINMAADSGDELIIFLHRDESLVHFNINANLRYSDDGFIPASVLIGLMRRNFCSKAAFWNLEKHSFEEDEDTYIFALKCIVEMSALDEKLFGTIVRYIAKECDDVNQMDEDIVMPSEE